MGEVILLHVVSQGETEAEIEDAVKKAKGQIEAIRSSLAAQGIEVRTIVRTGNPTFEITKIADEEDVSVIWMTPMETAGSVNSCSAAQRIRWP